MTALRYLVLLLWLAVALAGCGYRPVGSEPSTITSQGPPTLAIPPFANRSTEVGLESIMSNALIDSFAQTKAVQIRPGARDADLVLEGTVRSLDNTSVAFQDVTRSTVRRVTMRVELVLRQRRGGKIIWKDSELLQEDYVVDPTYLIGEATRTEGIRRAAVTLARRIKEKLLMVI